MGFTLTFVDKTMKLMVFATGNIYKSTGTGSEILQSPNIHTGGSIRQSQMILAKETFLDNATEWRVRWAQRGIYVFIFFGILSHIVRASTGYYVFMILVFVFTGLVFVCVFALFYKNVSFLVMKRLLKEPNVIIIIVVSLCYLAIDIGRPASPTSPMLGFIYIGIVNLFVLMDTLILKSRHLMLTVGFLFVALNLYELYMRTFTDYDVGVVLVEYSIQGNVYKFMRRATKRSIYFQVLLFSANGIYTALVDKSMKLMIFATGNIYKSTGTASEVIEDTSFAFGMKREEASRGEN